MVTVSAQYCYSSTKTFYSGYCYGDWELSILLQWCWLRHFYLAAIMLTEAL